ncbi:MAG: cysteine--tRNA ligase [Candidatus Baltobacteraceae bacterium]|jgi:cysteinyl-tRNA synthetase
MALRLYNSRTRTVEPFVPVREGHVRIYVCGLTPSAEAHLGHARSFMFFDVLRRYLVHRGYRVTYVQNVTDIDDRSIAAGIASGKPWNEIVEGFYQSFKRSMTRLHVLEPDREPRATEFIPQIVEMIAALIERGHAYAVGDGVYFAVRSFPRYGRLSGREIDELLVGARIAPDEQKLDPLDFALWKFAKPGEPSWPSPWGAGRPGWHIECSAMSHVLLGEPFDIHGGGFDLIFPHHENEIAQSESLLPAPPMANIWMHGGLLQFDGKKMSKSLGNFEPLTDLLDRHDPQAIRMLFLQAGYRKPLNFTEESIDGATIGLRRLRAAYDALRAAPPANGRGEPHEGEHALVAPYAARFHEALDDDVNTAGAVAALFELAGTTSALLAGGAASRAAAFLHEAMGLLGISPSERPAEPEPGDPLEALAPDFIARLQASLGDALRLEEAAAGAAIEAVLAARNAARQERDFARADRLRRALTEAGVILTDSKAGTTWTVVA